MEFVATTTIAATPMAIWAILTDADRFPTWEPNVTRVDGQIAADERITVHTRLSERAFPVRVTAFVPGERMEWTGGLPLGLFRGVRTFTLEPLDGRETSVTTREQFSGPLLPLFGRTIPDLQPTFEVFAAALKAEAEREAA